jgi:hypothetical protein
LLLLSTAWLAQPLQPYIYTLHHILLALTAVHAGLQPTMGSLVLLLHSSAALMPLQLCVEGHGR